MYYGIGKGEVKVRDTTEVFVIKNTGENSIDTAKKAINEFSVPRTFIKNRENGDVYDLDCFEDIENNVNDIVNGTVEDYVILRNNDELTAFQNFVNNNEQSVLIHSNKAVNTNSKKYDIYISYATFLGKKLRRRTLSVLNLNDINKIIILDLSYSKAENE